MREIEFNSLHLGEPLDLGVFLRLQVRRLAVPVREEKDMVSVFPVRLHIELFQDTNCSRYTAHALVCILRYSRVL